MQVFGGGGGTITPEEIAALQEYGVERLYHPDDGLKMGLPAMIDDVVERVHAKRRPSPAPRFRVRVAANPDGDGELSRMLSAVERGALDESELRRLRKEWQLAGAGVPVVGLTGTGGAGKSSVADELLNRFVDCFPSEAAGMRIAVLAVDPTRRRTGGALLGDRIRMNSLRSDRVFMRSMATRRQHRATSEVLGDAIALLKASGFSLVLVETAGIGQSDSEIVDLADLSVYVMTSDYGAASQLEKIDMLDFADVIVLNKCDRRGAQDALRDVPQAVEAEPPCLRDRRRGRARLSDDRQPVPGSRRQLDVLERLPAVAGTARPGRGSLDSRDRPGASGSRARRS